MIAKQKLTRKSEWKASGAMARIAKATIGPSIAPVVSSARWTPKAVPSWRFGVDREIIVSRGAVRMPFPMRSISTSRPMADRPCRPSPAGAWSPQRVRSPPSRPPCVDGSGRRRSRWPARRAQVAPW